MFVKLSKEQLEETLWITKNKIQGLVLYPRIHFMYHSCVFTVHVVYISEGISNSGVYFIHTSLTHVFQRFCLSLILHARRTLITEATRQLCKHTNENI